MKKVLYLIFVFFLLATHPGVAQNPPDSKNIDTLNRYDTNQLKTGYWVEREGEAVIKGYYFENKRVDNWIGYHPNHMIQKIEFYSRGLKNGISVQFDRKGKIMLVENYKNGLLNGTVTSYNPFSEAPVSEINYTKGKKNGVLRLYYDNGKLQEESEYLDDQKDGTSKWFTKNGKTIAIYNYKAGAFEGIQKTFFENDTIQVLSNYTGNQLSGEYKEFYRNGKVKIFGKYLNGQKDGPWTEYDELGKAVKVTKYKLGIQK